MMYEYRYKNSLADTKHSVELYPEDLEKEYDAIFLAFGANIS